MFDTLKNGINQKPLRSLNLNEPRDKPKEELTCHLWHFAAGKPDDAKHPFWNSSPALDTLTWETVPEELKSVSALPWPCGTSRTHLTLTARY